jgi:hypothetical protein
MSFTNSSAAGKMIASVSALFASWVLVTAAVGPVFVA